MAWSKYRGYSLRNRVFWGFLVVCLLSMTGATLLSYYIIKRNAIEQSQTDLQNKTNAVWASLDYAISQNPVTTADLPNVLKNKIMEIADINKHEIVIYDLKGNFLISSKDASLVSQKKIPEKILREVIITGKRVDVQEFDSQIGSNKTSSYSILSNNSLEPVGVLYLPYYHSDGAYLDVLNKYLKYMVLVNLLIILLVFG